MKKLKKELALFLTFVFLIWTTNCSYYRVERRTSTEMMMEDLNLAIKKRDIFYIRQDNGTYHANNVQLDNASLNAVITVRNVLLKYQHQEIFSRRGRGIWWS